MIHAESPPRGALNRPPSRALNRPPYTYSSNSYSSSPVVSGHDPWENGSTQRLDRVVNNGNVKLVALRMQSVSVEWRRAVSTGTDEASGEGVGSAGGGEDGTRHHPESPGNGDSRCADDLSATYLPATVWERCEANFRGVAPTPLPSHGRRRVSSRVPDDKVTDAQQE